MKETNIAQKGMIEAAKIAAEATERTNGRNRQQRRDALKKVTVEWWMSIKVQRQQIQENARRRVLRIKNRTALLSRFPGFPFGFVLNPRG